MAVNEQFERPTGKNEEVPVLSQDLLIQRRDEMKSEVKSIREKHEELCADLERMKSLIHINEVHCQVAENLVVMYNEQIKMMDKELYDGGNDMGSNHEASNINTRGPITDEFGIKQ